MPISKEDRDLIVADIVEALKPEPEDQKPETDVAALVEKVVAAELPAVLVKPVVEAVEAGASVEDAIKDQKTLVEAIRKGLTVSEDADSGVLSEAADKDNKIKTDADRGASYMERFGGKK